MKRILIFLIRIYQAIPGDWHYSCRFYPTCSHYAINSIEEYGCIKGILMAFRRILKCRPHGSFGYDPVKKEGLNEKNI